MICEEKWRETGEGKLNYRSSYKEIKMEISRKRHKDELLKVNFKSGYNLGMVFWGNVSCEGLIRCKYESCKGILYFNLWIMWPYQ